ncbi:hypothetical protein N2152v2_010686 [Parachlorella kessleri]
MNSGKVDICLEQLEAHQDALSDTKTGDALRVAQHDGTVGCSTPDGRWVGLLPSNLAPQFRHGSYVGIVRSLKRQDNVVTMLQVRITRGASSPQQGPPMPPKAEEEEQIARLSKEQLELLAQDEEVRWLLRDERLQKVVRDIDSAPDRERALLRALQAPNFKGFADKYQQRTLPFSAAYQPGPMATYGQGQVVCLQWLRRGGSGGTASIHSCPARETRDVSQSDLQGCRSGTCLATLSLDNSCTATDGAGADDQYCSGCLALPRDVPLGLRTFQWLATTSSTPAATTCWDALIIPGSQASPSTRGSSGSNSSLLASSAGCSAGQGSWKAASLKEVPAAVAMSCPQGLQGQLCQVLSATVQQPSQATAASNASNTPSGDLPGQQCVVRAGVEFQGSPRGGESTVGSAEECCVRCRSAGSSTCNIWVWCSPPSINNTVPLLAGGSPPRPGSTCTLADGQELSPGACLLRQSAEVQAAQPPLVLAWGTNPRLVSGSPLSQAVLDAPAVPGYRVLRGREVKDRYDYKCQGSLVGSECKRAGQPASLAGQCSSDAHCQGYTFFPEGSGADQGPLAFFKGGTSGSIDANAGNDNPRAALYIKMSLARGPRTLRRGGRHVQDLIVRAQEQAAVEERSAAKGKGKAGASSIGSGIRLEGVSVTFKNQVVLKNASWEVKKGERVGLVGVNGSGKTTQLQVVMGAVLPDAGEVLKARENLRIAHLSQEFDVEPSRTLREEFLSAFGEQIEGGGPRGTLREEFLSAFGEQIEILKRQEEIQQGLEECGDDMDRMAKLLDELSEVQSKGQDLDISLIDKKIDSMMPELGFAPEDNDRLVASFSGGWQMRMGLGKLLLQDPELLLLDEPTNHLDLDAIEWLEGYLKRQEVPMVIVSHDREFLDQLCTKVVETERGVTSTFKGNYSEYVKQKEEVTALQWVAFEKQQKEIARQVKAQPAGQKVHSGPWQDMVQRLAAGANSGRASTAEKTLEKLQSEGTLIEKPFVAKKRPFTFPPVERMGKVAVAVSNLTHGYNGNTLFRSADLVIERGERVAILGPNGAGKSTLLRLILGLEKPVQGTVELGPHHIRPNYFAQNQAEALDLDLTVLDTLIRAAPDAKLNDIKGLLGKMLFSGKGMEKKASIHASTQAEVGVLSGGEKARLALAKFMLSQGTLLVLDEPTNHLDIPSKETLEEAIRAFEGSVIAVSHDRYFLKRIATRIVMVENGKLVDYKGDYEVFLEENEDEAEKMAAKEEKAREIEKSNIKAKSKMSKAEKNKQKKEKAKTFNNGGNGNGSGNGNGAPKAATKNSKRWN